MSPQSRRTSLPVQPSDVRRPLDCDRISGPGIVIAASLDTKGVYVDFLRDELARQGLRPIVVDCSIRPVDGTNAEISADQIAILGGATMTEVRNFEERAPALAYMLDGLEKCIVHLSAAGLVAGFIGLGGGTNATLAARAFQALPYGVPKILVSTVASGDTKPFIRGQDVLLIHSVVDFVGLNQPIRASLMRAAHAMASLVRIPFWSEREPGPAFGVTAIGATTAAATAVDRFLVARGIQAYFFHARGPGGMSFEDLIGQGLITAALDLATTEIVDEVVGGQRSAGPCRLTAAAKAGIPQVVVPGGVDLVNFGAPDTVPARFGGRDFVHHTPSSTLMRTSPEENEAIGRWMGERLGHARGPTCVLVPLGGFSSYDVEGRQFHDPKATRAFVASMSAALKHRPDIPVRLIDWHINDPAFAELACEELWSRLDSGQNVKEAT